MTNWVEFFRIATLHGPRSMAAVSPAIVTEFDDDHTNQMAGCLYMVALPQGGETTMTDAAREWLAEGVA